MTWDELRSFAMGELGWSLERWRGATFTEFNYAVAGYWRNWERNSAWVMREIVYTLIAGNPYVKNKPSHPKEIFKISDDKATQDTRQPTAEELEAVRKQFANGILE